MLKINKLALYLHPVCCSLITKIPNWQLQFNMNTVYFSPVSFFPNIFVWLSNCPFLVCFALIFIWARAPSSSPHSITLAIWDIIQIITGAFNSQHILHGVRNSRVERKKNTQSHFGSLYAAAYEMNTRSNAAPPVPTAGIISIQRIMCKHYLSSIAICSVCYCCCCRCCCKTIEQKVLSS